MIKLSKIRFNNWIVLLFVVAGVLATADLVQAETQQQQQQQQEQQQQQQNDTTSEETTKNDDDNDDKLKFSIDSVTEELVLSTLKESESVLGTNIGWLSMQSAIGDIKWLNERIIQLEELSNSIHNKRDTVDALLRRANAKQLHHLLDKIDETYEKESKLRSADKKIQNDNKNDNNNNDNNNNNKETTTVVEVEGDGDSNNNIKNVINEEIFDSVVSRSLLKKKLETKAIMYDSEEQLTEWINDIMDATITKFQKETIEQMNEEKNNNNLSCLTPKDIVHDIQTALMKHSQDAVGMIDHLQGAEVVYEMTSPSYEPPPKSSQLLGNVWWRQYIPDDWEQLLPSGWQVWNVAIPSYIYHSLGLKGGAIAPPETVQNPKTLPGSCWPMDGRDGQITFRLPYPMRISAITIEHVSSLIVPEGSNSSAPKRIKILGYPPCDGHGRGDNSACVGLGFDKTIYVQIAEFTYSNEQSIETFDVMGSSAKAHTHYEANNGSNDDDDDDDNYDDEYEDDEDEDSYDPGTCSVATSSCSAPVAEEFSGITVQILDNWGNPDYTCLYRVRLHGEPI